MRLGKFIVCLFPLAFILFFEILCLLTQEFTYWRFIDGMLFYWVLTELIKNAKEI